MPSPQLYVSLVNTANSQLQTSLAGIADGEVLPFGDDSDAVIVLDQTARSADEEITSVIEGTSDHLGHAANTLIISNVTDDGDVHLLVSKDGNSHTAFLADGSTGDTILNASTGQSVDIYVAGTKEYDFSASDADFNSNTLSNVGAAGNDWADGVLTLQAAGTSTMTIESTGTSSGGQVILAVAASASSAYGGPIVTFKEGNGAGAANNMGYHLGYNAASNYFYLRSRDTDGSATDADIWRVPDGQSTSDANTTWDANVFDDYDDAMVLNPYRDGVLNLAERREELIEMGVLKRYSDGWIGHNDQRMEALLAGGIYQNRTRIDSQYEELNKRLEAIGA